MPGPLAAATALQHQLSSDLSPDDPLSARESQVAELVARAMSNRDIAAELFLSERTVESHVRSILNKRGFATRTQIATWWIKQQERAGR